MAVPRPLLLAALSSLALAACNRAPAEPDGQTASPPPGPAVVPLLWDAPSTWTRLDLPAGTPRKAAYQIPTAGNDTTEADAEVIFLGTGAAGDPAAGMKEWLDQFDGNAGATAIREKLHAGELEVETVEVAGTYKVALARAPRARKAAVQMVKKGYRLYGAVVKTKDRGNWFFKLVGPDETVQAARGAFRGMVESAR